MDDVPLVALASGLAGKVEELFHTGYVGTVDRGARCILRGAAEPSELPPPRITGPLLRPREQPPPELLPGGAMRRRAMELPRGASANGRLAARRCYDCEECCSQSFDFCSISVRFSIASTYARNPTSSRTKSSSAPKVTGDAYDYYHRARNPSKV